MTITVFKLMSGETVIGRATRRVSPVELAGLMSCSPPKASITMMDRIVGIRNEFYDFYLWPIGIAPHTYDKEIPIPDRAVMVKIDGDDIDPVLIEHYMEETGP